MSDEIDKALEGLTKKELIEVIRLVYPGRCFSTESLSEIAIKVKARSLRAKAEAQWALYEAVDVPAAGEGLAGFFAAINKREEAFSEYMRLSDRADELEFGTKRGVAR